jgi:hypothetical protein
MELGEIFLCSRSIKDGQIRSENIMCKPKKSEFYDRFI